MTALSMVTNNMKRYHSCYHMPAIILLSFLLDLSHSRYHIPAIIPAIIFLQSYSCNHLSIQHLLAFPCDTSTLAWTLRAEFLHVCCLSSCSRPQRNPEPLSNSCPRVLVGILSGCLSAPVCALQHIRSATASSPLGVVYCCVLSAHSTQYLLSWCLRLPIAPMEGEVA